MGPAGFKKGPHWDSFWAPTLGRRANSRRRVLGRWLASLLQKHVRRELDQLVGLGEGRVELGRVAAAGLCKLGLSAAAAAQDL